MLYACIVCNLRCTAFSSTLCQMSTHSIFQPPFRHHIGFLCSSLKIFYYGIIFHLFFTVEIENNICVGDTIFVKLPGNEKKMKSHVLRFHVNRDGHGLIVVQFDSKGKRQAVVVVLLCIRNKHPLSQPLITLRKPHILEDKILYFCY